MPAPPHSLQKRLSLPCSHMLAPPHSLQKRLSLPCSHMLAPPHSLQLVLRLPCRHMLAPPHSLHRRLSLPCRHMLAPPHSLHRRLSLPCAHMLAPPHSLHRRRGLCLPCAHMLAPPHSLHRHLCLPCAHLPPLGVCARARLASLPESVPLAFRFLFAPCVAPSSYALSSVPPPAVPSDRANASCGGGLVRLARSLKKGRAPGAASALSRWAIKSNEDQTNLGTSLAWSVTLRARFQFGTRGAEEHPNRHAALHIDRRHIAGVCVCVVVVFEFSLDCALAEALGPPFENPTWHWRLRERQWVGNEYFLQCLQCASACSRCMVFPAPARRHWSACKAI
jgi:hypothetical protein